MIRNDFRGGKEQNGTRMDGQNVTMNALIVVVEVVCMVPVLWGHFAAERLKENALMGQMVEYVLKTNKLNCVYMITVERKLEELG